MRHWFESAVERLEPNRGADMKDRSMSAPRRAMKALVRAWWAFDLAWRGTPRRPPRLLVRAAVHPVITGFGGVLFFGGTMAVGIGRIYPPVVIWGLAMGVVSYLTAVIERKSMEHYGFLSRPTPHAAPAPENRWDRPGHC